MKSNTAGALRRAFVGASFVKVPDEAMELARNITEKGCVSEIYRLANQNFWRPLSCTMTGLAAEFGVGRRQLRTLIDRLQDEGFVIWSCKRGPGSGELLVLEPIGTGFSDSRQTPHN